MNKRIIATILIFVLTFGLVYGMLSGGMAVFSRRSVAYDTEAVKMTQDFGIPKEWQEKYGVSILSEVDLARDDDNDGLTLKEEYMNHTDPTKADTDGDGYNDGREVANGYDPTVPGDARIAVTVEIAKIDVKVPVVLAKCDDEKTLESDLNFGVIHYPGTPLPGQRGNAYIAGHSSNYSWSKGKYNYVFKRLNEVQVGDTITVRFLLHNRKEVVYNYVVQSNEETAPDDPRIFAQGYSKELTIKTCWPLGSDARRLMVKAVLQSSDHM